MTDFKSQFEKLTGNTPMDWQVRLYDEHFSQGELPDAVDVPTGLGKTSVMALWLLARAAGVRLPRRLVYVVDRRAVVDQATDFAILLRQKVEESPELKSQLGLENELSISTLRGQFADNRQWLDSPVLPSIVVGTVDMIGSRLLFEGYGVSKKMRPYHAGFLGSDSLIVLDESHLVPPFEALLRDLFSEQYRAVGAEQKGLVPSSILLPLSATGNETSEGNVFHLLLKDYEKDDEARRRFQAGKELVVSECGPGRLAQSMAERAWELGEGKSARIAIFTQSRDDAQKVAAELSKRAKSTEFVELLVGARRVKERQCASARLEELGFLSPKPGAERRTLNGPSFLVATSAGEVGVDIDADHAVFDLVPWERTVQRLGRVNRRGRGQAQVELIVDPKRIEVDKSKTLSETMRKRNDAAQRLLLVRDLLDSLPPASSEGRDASPRALVEIKASQPEKVREASTPPPLRPELSRPLLETWSLTSLTTDNPARPEIRPWLRGWTEEPFQTTVVWRRHLPLKQDQPKTAATKNLRGEINKFFEAAPVHLTEGLETETSAVVDWLLKRAVKGTGDVKSLDVLGYVLDPAGELRLHGLEYSLRTDFVREGAKNAQKIKAELHQWLAGSVLVVDARLGGLGLSSGLLDHTEERCPETLDGRGARAEDWGPIRFRISEDKSASAIYQWTLSEEPMKSLFVLRGDQESVERARSLAPKFQTLDDHQGWAGLFAEEMASKLKLPPDYHRMVCLVARHHDEGKRAHNWQDAFGAPKDGKVYAKTPGPIRFDILGGYRHELGSLDYFDAVEGWKDLPTEVQELGLHMVSAHHGQGRPTIRTDGFLNKPPPLLKANANEVAFRFARLQRRWGPLGLAWWESLLRAIDQRASSKTGSPVIWEQDDG